MDGWMDLSLLISTIQNTTIDLVIFFSLLLNVISDHDSLSACDSSQQFLQDVRCVLNWKRAKFYQNDLFVASKLVHGRGDSGRLWTMFKTQ